MVFVAMAFVRLEVLPYKLIIVILLSSVLVAMAFVGLEVLPYKLIIVMTCCHRFL